MQNAFINITEKHFIASGAYCACYRHPDVPDQCIKVQTTNKKAGKRFRADIAYYKKLHHRQSDLRYIADYLGACETNLGQGSIYECVLDGDGAVSTTLKHYLETGTLDTEVLLKEIRLVAVHLLNHRIVIGDIHERNILIQSIAGQTPKPIVVDGIGDTVAITVLNVFKSHVHAKIMRRWNRFIDSLIKQYPERQTAMQQAYVNQDDIEG